MSDPEGDEKFFIGARPTLERFTEIEEIVAGLLKRMSNIERHCYQHDTIQHRIQGQVYDLSRAVARLSPPGKEPHAWRPAGSEISPTRDRARAA
jgi:hypothetical protein